MKIPQQLLDQVAEMIFKDENTDIYMTFEDIQIKDRNRFRSRAKKYIKISLLYKEEIESVYEL